MYDRRVVSTLQGLLVAVLALLPGASYTLAYERVAGSFGSKAPDRLIRFLAASAIFQAVFSGPTLLLYRNYITNGRLQRGEVNWLLFEMGTLLYVLIPLGCGALIGHGHKKGWPIARAITGKAVEPRAWDYVWNRNKPAVVRARLKSDTWVAGLYAEVDGNKSYASGYPEDCDLYLSVSIEINPETGELKRNSEGQPVILDGPRSLLVSREEIEYLDIQEF